MHASRFERRRLFTASVAVLATAFATPAAAGEPQRRLEAAGRFAAGLAAYKSGDWKGAIVEMTAALGQEKKLKRATGKEPNDAAWNLVKDQIGFMGRCVRAVSVALEGSLGEASMKKAAADMEFVYANKSLPDNFKKAPAALLGVDSDVQKWALVLESTRCAQQAAFFVGYQDVQEGASHAAIEHLGEYLAGKDEVFLLHALDARLGAYLAISDWTRALDDVERLIRLQPDIAQSWAIRGLVRWKLYERGGRTDRGLIIEADKDLTKSLSLQPGNPIAPGVQREVKELLRAPVR